MTPETHSQESDLTKDQLTGNRPKRAMKTASDILGDSAFHPDAPRVAFTELFNKQLVLVEAKIIRDFNGQFGKHDCALMLLQEAGITDREAPPFTTISSGVVVVERIAKLLDAHALPCLVTPVYVNDNYYNLV